MVAAAKWAESTAKRPRAVTGNSVTLDISVSCISNSLYLISALDR